MHGGEVKPGGVAILATLSVFEIDLSCEIFGVQVDGTLKPGPGLGSESEPLHLDTPFIYAPGPGSACEGEGGVAFGGEEKTLAQCASESGRKFTLFFSLNSESLEALRPGVLPLLFVGRNKFWRQ